MPKQADFSGVLNPKRVVEKRMEAAEAPSPPPAAPDNSAFLKKFSEAERLRQQEQLARILATRK